MKPPFLKRMLLMTLFAALSFSVGPVSARTLTPPQRRHLLAELKQAIAPYGKAKYLNACYRQAAAGDDHALSALYNLVSTLSLINGRENMLIGMLKKGASDPHIYRALERWATPAHVKAIHADVRLLPQEWGYCQTIYNRNHDQPDHATGAIERWIRMTVKSLGQNFKPGGSGQSAGQQGRQTATGGQ